MYICVIYSLFYILYIIYLYMYIIQIYTVLKLVPSHLHLVILDIFLCQSMQVYALLFKDQTERTLFQDVCIPVISFRGEYGIGSVPFHRWISGGTDMRPAPPRVQTRCCLWPSKADTFTAWSLRQFPSLVPTNCSPLLKYKLK